MIIATLMMSHDNDDTIFRCFHSGSLRQPLKAQVEGILIKRVSLNKCQTFLGLLAISRVAQLNILKQTFFSKFPYLGDPEC